MLTGPRAWNWKKQPHITPHFGVLRLGALIAVIVYHVNREISTRFVFDMKMARYRYVPLRLTCTRIHVNPGGSR